MSQLNTLLAASLDNYSPATKQYTVLGPVKAIERLARGGWTPEKVVIRHLANGNDEHLHVLSRPIPKPPPPPPPPPTAKKEPPIPPVPRPPLSPRTVEAAAKIKETLRGSRKP